MRAQRRILYRNIPGSRRDRRRFRHRAGQLSCGALARFMKSPVPMHCPSFDIFGTFFPAWMLCALIGIAGAIVAFKLVSVFHANRFVRVSLVFYPCVALSITSLVWLGWYGR
jgi:YtcA family